MAAPRIFPAGLAVLRVTAAFLVNVTGTRQAACRSCSVRRVMSALGGIQALQCNKNNCPIRVTAALDKPYPQTFAPGPQPGLGPIKPSTPLAWQMRESGWQPVKLASFGQTGPTDAR
jgi:hypothetical protein